MTLPPSTAYERFRLHQEARRNQMTLREYLPYLEITDPYLSQADALLAAQREPLWPAVRRVLGRYAFSLDVDQIEGYLEATPPSLDVLMEIHQREIEPRLKTKKPSILMRPLLELLRDSTMNTIWRWAITQDNEPDLGWRMHHLYEDALATLSKQHS